MALWTTWKLLRPAQLGLSGMVTPGIASISTTSRRWFATTTPGDQGGQPLEPKNNAQQEAGSSNQDVPYGGLPTIIVFGGNGYVGSHICQQALKQGFQVVSVNRSGRPAHLQGPWLNDVDWVMGDALKPETYKDLLPGASAVITTVGTFGTNDVMYKVCGTANIEIFNAAADAGVGGASFISVHDYKFAGAWHMQDFLLKGYFQGKRDAEKVLFERFPASGVALRPSFIYGTRQVGNLRVPMGLVGAPLDKVLGMLPVKSLASIPIVGPAFVPPVSVEAVAKAAVAGATDPSVPPGPMEVWEIKRLYE